MDIHALLKEMTLKEKVGQLNQRLYGWEVYEKTPEGIVLTETFKDEVARWGSLGFLYGVFRSDPWSGRNLETGLSTKEAYQVSQMIQAYIKANTRLKIPVFLSEECPHGHQAIDATTLPTNITSGASWNPKVYQQAQSMVASELREKGAHLSLISTLDVARDPRWGRTEECFSEDSYLTGVFSQAALKGLQGERDTKIKKDKSLAVLKHFAAQGSTMGGHNAGPVSLGERELYDIHLWPMKASIDAGAKLTMAAYNDLDGVPCHGNKQLLTDILREDFGFDGAVMADGCALDRLLSLTGNYEQAAAWAIDSGVDISLWDQVFPHLETAVLSGILAEEILDKAVLRILTLKEEMGLFEDAHPLVTSLSQEEKQAINLRLATESLVLVKNENNTLPLNNGQQIALIGPASDNLYHLLGDYSPFKKADAGYTILQGLNTVCEKTVLHTTGTLFTESIPDGIKNALEIAKQADAIVVAIGGCSTRDFSTTFDDNGAALSGSNEMTSGENMDLADLSIPAPQIALLKKLHSLNKPIVAVIISGRPYSLKEIEPYVNSILVAGYPGEMGGLAIANILIGIETPSGKLAMSIPHSSTQLPVYYNYRNAAFKEDYIDISGKAMYPFGHGLSYAKFSISDVTARTEDGITVTGRIKNLSSTRTAAEVIQVYLYRKNSRVIPRVKELKGFKKLLLQPLEEKNFTIHMTPTELEEYVPNKGYQLVHGKMVLMVETTGYAEKIEVMI